MLLKERQQQQHYSIQMHRDREVLHQRLTVLLLMLQEQQLYKLLYGLVVKISLAYHLSLVTALTAHI